MDINESSKNHPRHLQDKKKKMQKIIKVTCLHIHLPEIKKINKGT